MAAALLALTCASPLFRTRSVTTRKTLTTELSISTAKLVRRCSGKEQVLLEGMPPEYYDDEWQAQQREKTKELRRMQREEEEEEEEEERKIEKYREIGMRLKEFPEEDLRKAKKLVSSFIRAAEEVEERIEEAAEKGELDELLLMIIWNRLDLARRDTEILKRQATPTMKLLNDLLNMHDGFEDDVWLNDCRKLMAETFPREDPFSILMPSGFDIDMHQGPLRSPIETDNTFLRVDFVREVDVLLQEVRIEEDEEGGNKGEGLDPDLVETILDLAINLKW